MVVLMEAGWLYQPVSAEQYSLTSKQVINKGTKMATVLCHSLFMLLVVMALLFLLYIIIDEVVTFCLRYRHQRAMDYMFMAPDGFQSFEKLRKDRTYISITVFALTISVASILIMLSFSQSSNMFLNSIKTKRKSLVCAKLLILTFNAFCKVNTIWQRVYNSILRRQQFPRHISGSISQSKRSKDNIHRAKIQRKSAQIESFEELFPDYS